MFIFDADLEEETIRSAVARYSTLIESRGAEPGPIDFWGKRRFAYELKHRWEGYYVVLQARAEPAAMEELHRVLSLADEVLRHKILRIPEQVYGKLTGSGSGSASERRPERQAGSVPERQAGSVPERQAVPEPEPEAGSAPEPDAATEPEPEREAEASVTDA
jgi:small subunit ribosomal protein S6